jgi:cytochrome bd-type quinol oxidase subunit 2
VPGLLGFLAVGETALALAPALRVLTWPFLALTLLMLGRGWYVELSDHRRRRSDWKRGASMVLVLSTLIAATLWGLRFAGLLGAPLF